MMITFVDSNDDCIPEPVRAQIDDVLRQAIQAARPERECWRVTMHELEVGQVRIYDFALGVEAARSLTLTGANDPEYTTLFRAASHFLRTQWPGVLTLA
jgi:hypothetical protein